MKIVQPDIKRTRRQKHVRDVMIVAEVNNISTTRMLTAKIRKHMNGSCDTHEPRGREQGGGKAVGKIAYFQASRPWTWIKVTNLARLLYPACLPNLQLKFPRL